MKLTIVLLLAISGIVNGEICEGINSISAKLKIAELNKSTINVANFEYDNIIDLNNLKITSIENGIITLNYTDMETKREIKIPYYTSDGLACDDQQGECTFKFVSFTPFMFQHNSLVFKYDSEDNIRKCKDELGDTLKAGITCKVNSIKEDFQILSIPLNKEKQMFIDFDTKDMKFRMNGVEILSDSVAVNLPNIPMRNNNFAEVAKQVIKGKHLLFNDYENSCIYLLKQIKKILDSKCPEKASNFGYYNLIVYDESGFVDFPQQYGLTEIKDVRQFFKNFKREGEVELENLDSIKIVGLEEKIFSIVNYEDTEGSLLPVYEKNQLKLVLKDNENSGHFYELFVNLKSKECFERIREKLRTMFEDCSEKGFYYYKYVDYQNKVPHKNIINYLEFDIKAGTVEEETGMKIQIYDIEMKYVERIHSHKVYIKGFVIEEAKINSEPVRTATEVERTKTRRIVNKVYFTRIAKDCARLKNINNQLSAIFKHRLQEEDIIYFWIPTDKRKKYGRLQHVGEIQLNPDKINKTDKTVIVSYQLTRNYQANIKSYNEELNALLITDNEGQEEELFLTHCEECRDRIKWLIPTLSEKFWNEIVGPITKSLSGKKENHQDKYALKEVVVGKKFKLKR
jgi:hypothetical protein